MNNIFNKKTAIALALLFSSMFQGCIGDDNPVTPTIPTPTPIVSVSPSIAPSSTVSPVATPKPSVTPTPVVSSSPTVKPSPTPTATMTPVATPSPSVIVPTPTPSTVTGYPDWAEVFFSKVNGGTEGVPGAENIDQKLIEKLKSAKKTIDCALYDVDSDIVANAFIEAKNRGVIVRIVTDTDYVNKASMLKVKQSGIPVVDDNRSAIMHDKFIIIDSEYVWTGSFNTTDNDAGKNNNNAIIIHSKDLSDNYDAEFKEMFIDKQFGPSSNADIPHPLIKMNDGTELISLFSPENKPDKFIIDEIKNAKKQIYFMVFSFTHDEIGQAMIDKFKQGVELKGIFETRGAKTEYSEYPKMKAVGIDVRLDANKYNLHHKVIIVDGKVVMMGSFNFSANATDSNDENLLTIRNNSFIANNYLDEFNSLYSIATKE